MATSIIDGPLHVYGPMAAMASPPQTQPVIDPDSDAGPNLSYQGVGVLDPRIIYQKDRVLGRLGSAQAFFISPRLKSIGQIPCALAANNIAASQHITTNTAMTLAASSLGITTNVPIRPFSGSLNGSAAVTAAIALDFGYAFANCTSGNATVTVSDSSLFVVGMPLVIGGVGNSGGTIPLLCNVTALASATTITLSTAPLASNATAPVGMGDLWNGGQNASGQAAPPQAAYPFIAGGTDLFLDSRQAVTRGVRIVASGGSGGTVTVAGWDIYGQPMTETITVGSGAATGWGKKAFKYIGSVTPNYTDGVNNYTVGTSDVFGFAFRSSVWEDTVVFWAAAPMTAATGWVAADTTTPSSTTGDVRGTIQTSGSGGGSGIGASASNGSVSSLAMSGRRLEMSQLIGVSAMTQANPANANSFLGATQA